MRYYHKFALVGFFLSLIPLILGIVALSTRHWIRISPNGTLTSITYGISHRCQSNTCIRIPSLLKSQSLILTNFVLFILSLFIGIICTAFSNRRILHIYPPTALYISSIFTLFSLLFYVKSIVELHPELLITEFKLGYSIILMFLDMGMGVGLMGYFSFTAGYIYHPI